MTQPAAERGLYGSDRSLLSPAAAALADRNLLKWVIAITAAIGALLEVIDTSIVNVALPDIQGNLGATLSEVGWVSTGYACANVVMIPLTAWLSDRFGRRQYLTFSLAGFTAASVMCGMSSNLATLVIARILQGLAGGGLLAKAQAVLFETFDKQEQPMAQAIFGIGVIAGPAFGPVLGGYLTDTLGWRWIFFINLPVGILAVILTVIFLPRDPADDKAPGRVDWTGIGLLTLGLACFQTMLEQGEEDDWFGSHFIALMAVGAAVGIALFIWRELSIDYPAVDLRVLKYRSLSAGSVYSLVLGMGIYGVIFAIPVFVQDYLHFTAMQSGILQIPSAMASAIAMILMGKISGRYDARLLIAIGALITVAAALLFSDINPDTSAESLFWPLFLRGLGSVCMFLPLSLATLGSLPLDKVSSGSGFYNLTRQLGSSIGIALITTEVAHREAVHRSVLVEHISLGRAAVQRRLDLLTGAFAHHSADPVANSHRALALVDRIVNGQAMLLSFADVFFYVAAAFVVLPLLFSWGGVRPKIWPRPPIDVDSLLFMTAASVLRHPVRTPLLVLVAAGALFWTGKFLYHYWRFETTDDAYITGHIHEISSEVNGQVRAVPAHENELVKAGQTLVEIDPLEFDIGAERARAALAQSQADAAEAKAAVAESAARLTQAKARAAQAKAQADAAKAQAALARTNLKRDEAMNANQGGAVTAADLDTARATAAAAEADAGAAEANTTGADADILAAAAGGQSAAQKYRAAEAAVELAKAAVRDAGRNLSYVSVKAPADGRIGDKNVEIGNRVQTGQTLMVLIEPEVWVEANFKETQLAHIRAGQPVEISVDAIPGHTFAGKVESFAPATGAEFALLPPDNATGNFTKVVQRVPVRVRIDPESIKGYEDRLRPGLSATVDVDVR